MFPHSSGNEIKPFEASRWDKILMPTPLLFSPLTGGPLPLMEEILHHMGYINLVNNGMTYQLVQDFFHQQHHCKMEM